MILKSQSMLFPYARQREVKQPLILSKQDKINSDRIVMAFLFAITIAAAVVFS